MMPLAVAEPPIEFPKMSFYLLWHDRSHYEEECRRFREQIISVVRNSPALRKPVPVIPPKGPASGNTTTPRP